MTPEAWAGAGRALFFLAAPITLLLILGLTVLLCVAAAGTRSRNQRAAASAAATKAIYDAIVNFLAGSSNIELIRRYLVKQREDVAATLLRFQTTVGGSARDRLCELALDFGLVHDWCQESRSRDVLRRRMAFSRLAFASGYEPVRRVASDFLVRGLNDDDEECRLAASLGVLHAGLTADISQVFELAIGRNLLTRVVLSETLRQHAMMLITGPVREALRAGDPVKVRGALEILVAWERAIPLAEVGGLLDHQDRAIRVLALRLAPLVPAGDQTGGALVRALGDKDREVRLLAVEAAGRLKMAGAEEALVGCLRSGDIDVARQAAVALAGISPAGRKTLEEASSGSNRVAAYAAREALGRKRGGS